MLILLQRQHQKYKILYRQSNSPLDTDNEDKLRLVRDVEVALLAGDTTETDLLTLSIAVLLDVGLGTLENGRALLLVGLWFIQLAMKPLLTLNRTER